MPPSGDGIGEAPASKHKDDFKQTTARQRYDKAISDLLGELCVGLGFCGTPDAAPFDHKREAWTADEFAREILRAEGGGGGFEEKWFKPLRKEFVARFGLELRVADFEEGEAARRLALLGGHDPMASGPRRRRE